jgi:DNA modification methylase
MSKMPLKEYQEDRYERGVYDQRNTINDLTGKEWLFSTKTIIPKKYPNPKTSSETARPYSVIPVELFQELVETFSKPTAVILDPQTNTENLAFGISLSNKRNNASTRSLICCPDSSSSVKDLEKLFEHLESSSQPNIMIREKFELNELPSSSVDLIITNLLLTDIIAKEELMSSPSHQKNIIEEWLFRMDTILKLSIDKLKDLHYVIVGLPFPNLETLATTPETPSLNFSIIPLFTSRMKQHNLVLKAERFWFEPNLTTKEVELLSPSYRFLVFRKENDSAIRENQQFNVFEKTIPIGPTYILHRSFPPSFEHKLRSQHGGMKPPELVEILINRYSRNISDIIFDPFVGVGGTLLGATLAKREALGVDINSKWQEVYKEVCKRINLSLQQYLVGDSVNIIQERVDDSSIGMIMTDVPYWAMDKLKKTRGRYSKAGEESRQKLHTPLKHFDEAEILTLDEWKDLLTTVFSQCYQKLASGKYLVVFIGNMYRTLLEQHQGKKKRIGQFLLLSSILADILLSIGYQFKEEIIWYAPDKALHIFGYPYSYIPSVVHQCILVFNKK